MAEVIRINESTWRIEDGMVRFFLFAGNMKAALIDSGMTVPNAKEIAEGLTDLPIIMVNTHADPDHISGNGAFEEVYMSKKEEGNYREHKGNGTIIPIGEGDVIDLGDRTLKVIDIPGHTPGSVAFLDEKYRILISGDSVQDGDIFMFGEKRDISDYIHSMKHLLEFDGLYDDIYAMHGSFPVKGDLIGKLIDGAKKIQAGEAEGQKVEIFGNEILRYRFDYAGFLCELKD